jgi:hypothetical protein
MKKLFLFFTVICFCCAVQAQTANDYHRDAEEGVVEAQYKLGVCYFNGDGITKDCEKAMCRFTKAAEQEHAMAQYSIAKALDEVTSTGFAVIFAVGFILYKKIKYIHTFLLSFEP